MVTNFFDSLSKPFLVAEIGNNHEGDLEIAHQLIDKAASSGADGIKLQIYNTEDFISSYEHSTYERLKRFELSQENYIELIEHIKSTGAVSIATPLDLKSADLVIKYCDIIKIASGDNNFSALLNKLSNSSLPTIISTGFLGIKEILQLNQNLKKIIHKNLYCLLYCVSNYPVAVDECKLTTLCSLINQLECPIGYSDHTIGPKACIVAATLGARVVEKHFTLSNNFSSFRDHELSANSEEFKYIRSEIDLVNRLLGTRKENINVLESELEPKVRRGLAANRDMHRGEIVTLNDISWIRPLGEYGCGDEHVILNKLLSSDIKKHNFFTKKHF